MLIPHLRTVVGQVMPAVIPPPCVKGKRNCRGCPRLGFCKSPVSWCALPYNDKKGGCPRFGKDCECPPNAPIFDEVFEMTGVKMVACEFDISAYLLGMHWAHPDWNERQLRNVIYWQGQAKKVLESAVREHLQTEHELTPCFSPEAMGVDLRPTAEQLGITLEFQPTSRVWKIALLAKKKGAEGCAKT